MYKVALLALAALFIPIAAFAAPSISLETDNTSIKSLDTVLVFGEITGVKDYKPASLQVVAPDGEIVYSFKIKPTNDGTIKRLIHPPLPSFKVGTYTVTLSHPGISQTAQIEFTVTSEPLTRNDAIPVSELEPEVSEPELTTPDFEQPLIITADAVEGDTVITIIGRSIITDQSVSITVNSPNGNLVTVSQVVPDPDGEFSAEIKTGGPLWKEDGLYTVTAFQGRSSELEHSVTVGIQDGVVIPEFGTITVLVLSVSIISIIVLTRTRASMFPRI